MLLSLLKHVFYHTIIAEKDSWRTDRHLDFYNESTGYIQSLQRILKAFVIYDSEMGVLHGACYHGVATKLMCNLQVSLMYHTGQENIFLVGGGGRGDKSSGFHYCCVRVHAVEGMAYHL